MSESNIIDRRKLFDTTDNRDSGVLVEKLRALESEKNPVKRKTIPDGFRIAEFDDETFELALKTWLRTTRQWSSMTISFAKEPDKYKLTKTVVATYPNKLDTPEWLQKEGGLDTLRETILRAIRKNATNLVKICIEKTGITFYTDADKAFGPAKKATAKDVVAYNTEVKKLKETEPDRTFPELKSGDELFNPDYEPFIEWIAVPKAKPY